VPCKIFEAYNARLRHKFIYFFNSKELSAVPINLAAGTCAFLRIKKQIIRVGPGSAAWPAALFLLSHSRESNKIESRRRSRERSFWSFIVRSMQMTDGFRGVSCTARRKVVKNFLITFCGKIEANFLMNACRKQFYDKRHTFQSEWDSHARVSGKFMSFIRTARNQSILTMPWDSDLVVCQCVEEIFLNS